MTYRVDFREKVVAFVRNGGGQAEAARRFDISLWCVRDWLVRQDLRPQQQGVPRLSRAIGTTAEQQKLGSPGKEG